MNEGSRIPGRFAKRIPTANTDCDDGRWRPLEVIFVSPVGRRGRLMSEFQQALSNTQVNDDTFGYYLG